LLARAGATTEVEAPTKGPEADSEAQTKPSRRKINDGDTLSGIASEALGAGASIRDIYNYVRQIEEVFNSTSTPQETSNALIDTVKRVFNGMRIIYRLQDNTSVVVLEPNLPKPVPYVKPSVNSAKVMPLRAAQPYAISAGWVNGVEDSNAKKAI
jgi:hypothetical protein